MQIKFKTYKKYIVTQVTRFGDIRFTGQVIFIAVVLLITWSGIQAIQSNYKLQQQVSEIKQQNQVASLQNSTIALQNEYYKSNQYLELSARQNFGLALPGEKELLVPQSVALSYTVNPPTFSGTSTSDNSTSSQLNFITWVDFFLHRGNDIR